jgi:hypothetical protein
MRNHIERSLMVVLVLAALSAPLASQASEEFSINMRQVGPEPTTQVVHKSKVEVVELRGDPNFVDRQFLETEKKDNKLFASANREPAAVQGLRTPKALKPAGAHSKKSMKKKTRVASNQSARTHE